MALTGHLPQSEIYNPFFQIEYSLIQNYHNTANKGLAELELPFTTNELRSYTNARKLGQTKKSGDRIEQESRRFWSVTHATVNKKSMDDLLSTTLKKYQFESARGKTLRSLKTCVSTSQKQSWIPAITPSKYFLIGLNISKCGKASRVVLLREKIWRIFCLTFKRHVMKAESIN